MFRTTNDGYLGTRNVRNYTKSQLSDVVDESRLNCDHWPLSRLLHFLRPPIHSLKEANSTNIQYIGLSTSFKITKYYKYFVKILEIWNLCHHIKNK